MREQEAGDRDVRDDALDTSEVHAESGQGAADTAVLARRKLLKQLAAGGGAVTLTSWVKPIVAAATAPMPQCIGTLAVSGVGNGPTPDRILSTPLGMITSIQATTTGIPDGTTIAVSAARIPATGGAAEPFPAYQNQQAPVSGGVASFPDFDLSVASTPPVFPGDIVQLTAVAPSPYCSPAVAQFIADPTGLPVCEVLTTNPPDGSTVASSAVISGIVVQLSDTLPGVPVRLQAFHIPGGTGTPVAISEYDEIFASDATGSASFPDLDLGTVSSVTLADGDDVQLAVTAPGGQGCTSTLTISDATPPNCLSLTTVPPNGSTVPEDQVVTGIVVQLDQAVSGVPVQLQAFHIPGGVGPPVAITEYDQTVNSDAAGSASFPDFDLGAVSSVTLADGDDVQLAVATPTGEGCTSTLTISITPPPMCLSLVTAPGDGSTVPEDQVVTGIVVQLDQAVSGVPVQLQAFHIPGGVGPPVAITEYDQTVNSDAAGSASFPDFDLGAVSSVTLADGDDVQLAVATPAGGACTSTLTISIAPPPMCETLTTVPADGSTVGTATVVTGIVVQLDQAVANVPVQLQAFHIPGGVGPPVAITEYDQTVNSDAAGSASFPDFDLGAVSSVTLANTDQVQLAVATPAGGACTSTLTIAVGPAECGTLTSTPQGAEEGDPPVFIAPDTVITAISATAVPAIPGETFRIRAFHVPAGGTSDDATLITGYTHTAMTDAVGVVSFNDLDLGAVMIVTFSEGDLLQLVVDNPLLGTASECKVQFTITEAVALGLGRRRGG